MSEHPANQSLESISQLASKIEHGDISPVDLIESTLERIYQLDRTLNAFLEIWPEAALRDAQIAEKAISSNGYMGPLHGIPIGFKDLIDVQGRVTTGGSKILSGNVARQDATVVTKLKAAGAIVIGKLNLVEFAFGATGLNPHTGDVKNPWDTSKIAAGSSSGSAAAVASGMIPAALGSDTGGSIRMPASLCGIAGLKPTYGRVSRAGVLDLSWSMDHVGPMTRTTADCALMMNALAGHDPMDAASSYKEVPDFTEGLDDGFRGLTIGVPGDYFFDDLVDPAIVSAVRAAIGLMAANGAEVVEVPMPWVNQGRAINLGVMLPEAVSVHEKMLSKYPDQYTPAVRSRIQAGFNIPAIDYLRAKRAREWFNEKMSDSMKRIDVLVTPTVPILTPTISECRPAPGDPGTGGELPRFTGVFDVTGQPSVSIPCEFSDDGMPIGMMITGHPFDEVTVLRVGSAYEQLTDWHQRVPDDIATGN